MWIATPMSVPLLGATELARISHRLSGQHLPHRCREFVNLRRGDLVSLLVCGERPQCVRMGRCGCADRMEAPSVCEGVQTPFSQSGATMFQIQM